VSGQPDMIDSGWVAVSAEEPEVPTSSRFQAQVAHLHQWTLSQYGFASQWAEPPNPMLRGWVAYFAVGNSSGGPTPRSFALTTQKQNESRWSPCGMLVLSWRADRCINFGGSLRHAATSKALAATRDRGIAAAPAAARSARRAFAERRHKRGGERRPPSPAVEPPQMTSGCQCLARSDLGRRLPTPCPRIRGSPEARHIDEKLFLELCAAPPVPEAKTARQRR
jgi:hypothetical protein